MAFPPVIIGLISTAATDKRVQKIAGGLAAKAYGKLFGESNSPSIESPEIIASPEEQLKAIRRDLQDRPAREEFVASFALLEAKFLIEQRKGARLIRIAIVTQLVTVATLVGSLIF